MQNVRYFKLFKEFSSYAHRDKEGYTLLMLYVQHAIDCEPALIRELCKHIDVNARDNDSKTALYVAAIANKSIECFETLIDCGADANH